MGQLLEYDTLNLLHVSNQTKLFVIFGDSIMDAISSKFDAINVLPAPSSERNFILIDEHVQILQNVIQEKDYSDEIVDV
jgi:hypothetical protein